MQQFSPKQHAAAAVSSPQHSPDKSSFFTPPVTERFLLSPSNAVPLVDTCPVAGPTSLAVSPAAAAQQQALLAALAAELRNAVDRWCPVGRGNVYAAAAAAEVSSRRRLPDAASSSPPTSSPRRGEDGRDKPQLCEEQQPQQPSSSAEREQQQLVLHKHSPHFPDHHPLSSSSSSRSSSHEELCSWRCTEETVACAAGEFLPAISASLRPTFSSNDEQTSASLNSFSWGRQRLYHRPHCIACVISKTAVSLPTHLYREEAAIEEEDAAGLLGCLEDEGMHVSENDDSGFFYSTGEVGAGLPSSSGISENNRQQTDDPSLAVSPYTLQPDASHGEDSSSVTDENFPSRWGEWPLRTLSSENIDHFAAPATYGSSACSSAAGQRAIADSTAAQVFLRSGATADTARSRVSKGNYGEDAGTFSAAAASTANASTANTQTALSCCWETPETFFENISAAKSDAETATNTHHITPAAAPGATAPAATPTTATAAAAAIATAAATAAAGAATATAARAAAAAPPGAAARAGGGAENWEGDNRHRPSCRAPASLPSLAARRRDLRLCSASAAPFPHRHVGELASLATASTAIDAAGIPLESAAAAAGGGEDRSSVSTPPLSFSSSLSSSVSREPQAEKKSAVGLVNDGAAEGKRQEQHLQRPWKALAAKETELSGSEASVAAKSIEEDFSIVRRRDEWRDSGDGRWGGDRTTSGSAAAASGARELRSAEESMPTHRKREGLLHSEGEREFAGNHGERNARAVWSDDDAGEQALFSNERERATEVLPHGFSRRVHSEAEKNTTFSCASGNVRRDHDRSVAVVTASGNNDQATKLQAPQSSRRDAAKDQRKLRRDAGRGNDTDESASKKAEAKNNTGRRRQFVTTFEEVGLCITSPCSRSSNEREEAKAVDHSGKEEMITNSYKGRNTIRRKLLVSRSSSAPSVQRSPRATFSRLTAAAAARLNSKPQFSPRLTQRRQRLSVVADDARDESTLLKSPTRSTLFCTDTTSSSLAGAAGDAAACWGVSADHPLLLPRRTAAADGGFSAAARKHEQDVETQYPENSLHAGIGQSNQSNRMMQDSEEKKTTDDKSSQRVTASLMEEGTPSPNVRATTQRVTGPLPRRAAATAEKSPAGDQKPSALAADDICRRLAPQRTPECGRRNSELCQGAALVMQSEHHFPSESAEQLLLQNPAEAGAAAAAKAAAAATALCCRKSLQLSSPVVPESSSPASPASASPEGVHQFVCAWLEGCYTRLQAIARSSAAAAVPSQQIVEHQQVKTFSRDGPQGLENTGVSSHAILLESKRQVKEELKAYDVAFYRRYGRLPGRPEKEPLRPLYSHYQLLRRLLVRSEPPHTLSGLQPPSQKYQLEGTQCCAPSSSGSATLNDECRKHVAEKRVEVQSASSSLSTGTARTLTAGRVSVLASAVDATAGDACVSSVPLHLRSEKVQFVTGSKGTEVNESDVGRQTCHSLPHEKHRRVSIMTTGTERADDGAAALPVVEWNTLAVEAGTSAESACGGTRETEACHRVQQSSRKGGTRRRHAENRVVSDVKPSFTATRGADNLATEGSRVEAGSRSQENPQFRSRENLGDEQSPWVQKPNKGTEQPPFGCVSTAAATGVSAAAAGRSDSAFVSTQVSGSSILNDVTVHVRTSRSRTLSAKAEPSPGEPSVHTSFGSQAHREIEVSGKKAESLLHELRLNEESVTKTRLAHEEHSEVIAGQLFSNVYAARRRDGEENYFGEGTHAGKNCEKVCANVHRKDRRLQSNVRDSSESRDCRTRIVSHYWQQHQDLSVPTPAQTDSSTVGDADVRELAQNLKNQRRSHEASPEGRSDTCAGARKDNVDEQAKMVLTSRVNVQAVRKPQPGTAYRPQSADVQSQVESTHKRRPFFAGAVTEYQQRLVRLQLEKRMLRTKLLAYQAEFTAETGRVVQLYKDIAPIEREYRRYKEVKQEIARLTDKQCDTIFPAKESESHYQALEEDGIPSEKFDKGRREVCAS